MSTFTYQFDGATFKGSSTVHTQLFINNEWVDPVQPDFIDVVNPINGKVVTKVSLGDSADVDLAVKAARTAFKTTWGLNVPGTQRAALLYKLADLVEQHQDELCALESIDMGIPFMMAKMGMLKAAIDNFRNYAGWAGKVYGKTIETNPAKFAYTRREPIGVCAQIIAWNAPLMMFAAKVAAAVSTGCTVIVKPSEITPLATLRICDLIKEAGFPPGVINVVVGYGKTVGNALSHHMDINKISFTGSTLVGREVVKAAADSNLKKVTLELGGKSPNIIFDDADIEQVIKWTELGIYGNSGQACSAGSRIFVQEGIYDKFLEAFKAASQARAVGDPFTPTTMQGPMASEAQFNRVLGYIDLGKKEGASVVTGGVRKGEEGFFIEPTIFTNTNPDMRIVKEEIFGPVGVLIKFKTEEEVIEIANKTTYGLASGVFTSDLTRAIRISNALEAGTVWVNAYNLIDNAMPWGGYKESGWGRENSADVLDSYTEVKAVHINIGMKL